MGKRQIKLRKSSHVLLITVRCAKKAVARDLPGGKRIRIINMRAQHITFNKAIKTVLKDCKEF